MLLAVYSRVACQGSLASGVRIAIVSDIHGNRRALEAVIADLRQVAPDLILQGGDLAAGGAHPAEVIDQIRAMGWPGVYGNADEMLWAPQRLAEYAVNLPALAPVLARVADTIAPTVLALGKERVQWLSMLPAVYSQEGLTLLHASPGDVWRAPMPTAGDDELERVYGIMGAGLVVYGHIHCPFIRGLSTMTVANSGSVGQPYDGDRRASYVVVDGAQPSLRRVEYDVESEAKDVLRCGLPHAGWMSKILLAGRYCPPDSL